jgi:tetratricopeptide (TPR) repeat protein
MSGRGHLLLALLGAGPAFAQAADAGGPTAVLVSDGGAAPSGDAGVTDKSSATWKKTFVLQRAGDAWGRGKLDEAATLFRSVLKLDPGDETALLHLAAYATRRRDGAQAAALLQQGVAANPRSAKLQHELGVALLAIDRPKDASVAFRAAADADPKSADALVNLGDALRLAGARAAAIDAYREALARSPDSAWAHRQLGSALADAQANAEAVVHLERAAASFTKEYPLLLALGHAALRDGQLATAQRAYERAAALAPRADAFVFLGLAHEKQRAWPAAITAYLRATELAPKDANARVHLGNAYRQVGDLPRARAQYLKAGDHPWGLAQLGFLELEAGRADEAERVLQRAAKLAPDNADVGEALGDLKQKRKDFAGAELEYRRVLGRHRRHLGARVKLGDVLRALGRPEEALDAWRLAAAQHPTSVWAHLAFGDGRRALGQLADAIQQYRWALDLDPSSAWARRQLGFALFDAGDGAHAKELLTGLPEAVRGEPDVQLTLGHLARAEHAPDRAKAHYLAALAADANHVGALTALADLHRELGELGEALGAVRKAATLTGDTSKDVWTLRGDVAALVLDAQGAPDPALEAEAVEAYERAMRLAPTDPRPRRQLGFFAFAHGLDDRAEALLTQALKADPTDVELPLTLGHLAARRARLPEALGHYGHARSLAPGDVRPVTFVGATLRALAQLPASRAALEQAVTDHPESAWAHLELGYTAFAQRDSRKALAEAEASVRLDANNPEAWLFVSRLRQRRALIGPAVEAAERAVALAPRHALAHRALAGVLLDRAEPGDLARGLAALEPFVEPLSREALTFLIHGHLLARLSLAPGLDLPRGRPAEPKQKGQQAEEKRKALDAFERALSLGADDEVTRLSVGQGYVDLFETKAARQALAPLVAKDLEACPKDEFSLTWSLDQAVKDEVSAESPEEAARLERRARLAKAHLLLGELAEREQQHSQARAEYVCAIALAPDTAEAHLKLGLAYENKGLVRLAEEHAVAAVQLNPNLKPAHAAIERLQRQAGFPIGPIRVAVESSLTSDALPLEIAANVVRVTGADAAQRESLLTVPRLVRLGAAAAWRPEDRPDRPRFELQYDGLLGFGTFLTDRLQFENVVGHAGSLRATGRVELRQFNRAELNWRGGYRLLGATAPSRSELRHTLSAGARLVQLNLGALDAQLEYERGDYQPAPGVQLVERFSNAIGAEVRFAPALAWRRVEGLVTWRTRGVFLGSGRSWWSHRFDADALWRGDLLLFGGELSGGIAADRFPAGGPSVDAGSLGFLVKGGLGASGYTFALAKTGLTLVPGNAVFDAYRVGVDAQHRFFFRRQEFSLALSAGYELRWLFNAKHTDHLFMAYVTFGR